MFLYILILSNCKKITTTMLPKAPRIISSLLSTFLLLSLMCYPTKAQDPPFTICNPNPNSFDYYTQGSPYQSNLKLTLDSLASNISSNGFYNTTFGNHPNKVYGLLQCRADIPYEDCIICASKSMSEITEKCPNEKEAVLFSNDCELRYAGNRFFSIPSTTIMFNYYSLKNISNRISFSYAVEDLLNNISTKAAYDASKFAVGTIALTDSMSIFGMAQCTRDLFNDGCLKCLSATITHFGECCYGRRGGRVLSASCNFRYEIYPFFDLSLLPSPPAASPLPSVLKSPRNSEATDALKEKGSGSGTKKPLVIITISVLLAFFMLGSGVCFIFREKIIQKVRKVSSESTKSFIRRNYEKCGKRDYQGEKNGDLDLNLFDMDTIVKATYNFSDISLLGQGGFGCVYKGTLENGEEIAVKRLSKNSGQGMEEFKNEVMLIARLQHRNLVRLLGLCAEEQEKILVYEYMENKSLDAFLFNKTLNNILDWPKRFNIIMGISRGLLYLHQDSRFRIIHRDLKTSNVLLDSEMNPKISDFGMARIFGGDDAETETKRVVGTYGYMSPEYAMYGIFSVKSDVFSFGVLVLEIISGKKNRGIFCSEEQLSLLGYAWKLWKEGQALELIDETVKDSFLPNQALRCIQIGLLCVQENAKDRPTMPSVVLMLSTDTTKLQQPRQPGFSCDKSYLGTDTSTSKRGSCSANDITFTNLEAR